MKVKIISAPDKLTWYAKLIGQTVEAERRPWFSIKGVWAREDSVWSIKNFIPENDYVEVE